MGVLFLFDFKDGKKKNGIYGHDRASNHLLNSRKTSS